MRLQSNFLFNSAFIHFEFFGKENYFFKTKVGEKKKEKKISVNWRIVKKISLLFEDVSQRLFIRLSM